MEIEWKKNLIPFTARILEFRGVLEEGDEGVLRRQLLMYLEFLIFARLVYQKSIQQLIIE